MPKRCRRFALPPHSILAVGLRRAPRKIKTPGGQSRPASIPLSIRSLADVENDCSGQLQAVEPAGHAGTDGIGKCEISTDERAGLDPRPAPQRQNDVRGGEHIVIAAGGAVGCQGPWGAVDRSCRTEDRGTSRAGVPARSQPPGWLRRGREAASGPGGPPYPMRGSR